MRDRGRVRHSDVSRPRGLRACRGFLARMPGFLLALGVLTCSTANCFLTARGGRSLDPVLFLPGLVLLVVGIRSIMSRMGGSAPAWRRFLDGVWMAVFVLLG